MKSHNIQTTANLVFFKLVPAAFSVFFVSLTGDGRSDYVLLQDGRTLFNVIADDNGSTTSRPIRVRTRPGSFGYDPKSDTVFLLTKHSEIFNVADIVSTTTEYGKGKAVSEVRRQNWINYRPPVVPPLVAPTPEPTPIPSTVISTTEVVLPINVVPNSVPLKERLEQQLDQFIQEQSRIAFDLKTSVTRSLITTETAQQLRLKYLDRQREVLEKYYPTGEQQVQQARGLWDEMRQRVIANGRFDLESL